ncbi:MAG TPA: ATP-binding cassette domain-containing protein [Acidimicrobiales bacterium]|nr:ATP-binding cassette domain-containing protein [Acidimicrobiales bacterium]
MPEDRPAPPAEILGVDAMTLSFGGVVALDGVSLAVGQGEIVGLLGPNGAGKTTLLNVISGHLRGQSGRVRLFGQDVSALGPDRRARLGVSRTYQDGRLFPGLTVREAVQLGLARANPAAFSANFIGSLIAAPWVRSNERTLSAQADDTIEQFGLGPWAKFVIAHLSTGTRRVCDLAVQLAAGSRLLLLDEPTGGLAQRETEAMVPLLRDVSAGVGCSILVVEHDIPFLMDLADRLYALEAGRVIIDGPPALVRRHRGVLASYLGTTGR